MQLPMSNTYTRKVTQGELQKRKNEADKREQAKLKAEEEEAAKWVEGSRQITNDDLRKQKAVEKEQRKKYLQELYEKEME